MAKTNKVEELLCYIMRLDPVEFIGMSKILCAATCTEDGQPRDAAEIMTDMVENFINANRRTRKDILKMLKQVTKGRENFRLKEGEDNGDSTED